MTTPIMVEVDCSTGAVTERPLTAEEIAVMEEARLANEKAEAERQAEIAAKEAAKAAAHEKLAALGLTAEEIAAL